MKSDNGYIQDPIKVEAKIEVVDETEAMLQEVASVVDFPDNKTPDLLFFSGIFVSSGENLNKSYFLPEELIKALNTIPNKAIDIEHDESQIVGHIYSCSITDPEGNLIDIESLKSKNVKELNSMDLDVVIAGILYKSRFPDLAEEVKDGKWKLSMETYYQDYDIKIGSMILSRKEAEVLGIIDNSSFGSLVRVVQNGKEIAKGKVTKVLKTLLFSGCGLVKMPANPRSLILETANQDADTNSNDDIITVDITIKNGESIDDVRAGGGKDNAQEFTSPSQDPGGLNSRDLTRQTYVGTCVNYKKRVIDAAYEGPDTKILHENWCTLYDTGCTSPSREATHPECLRRKIIEKTRDYTKTKLESASAKDKRGYLLSTLKSILNKF